LRKEQLFNKALENFIASEKIHEGLGDQYGLALSRLNIGSLYIKKKNIKEARKMLISSFELFKQNNVNDLTKDACQMLAQCDSTEGNWKGAYEYHKLYKQYSDSIFTDENSRKLAEMSTRFETEQKEERIFTLEKDKKHSRLFFATFVLLASGSLFFGKRAYDNKKKIAEFLKTDGERKEVLLQEVHHRINNNLQIISSLLTLQANSAGDEKLREYLKQSQNRIQSLSSLHELLYQNDSPLQVNMAEYLNKVLGFHNDVLKTLPGKIDLVTNIKEANFTTKLSVPIALIVNELVTNSLKYAFADGTNGTISVSLAHMDNDKARWILCVSDTGKGLPQDNNYRKDSLGLRLVNIMTKQIHGTLLKSNSPGATFKIIFNLTEQS
jgi:two-component sensor histidine kinase